MDIIAKTCNTNCYGYEGNFGSCCHIADKNWIIGPIHDAEKVLSELREDSPWLKWEDVFIGYEEGRNMFPERSVWQVESHYPAMRLGSGLGCVMYSLPLRKCTIYEKRPQTCRDYRCEFLSKRLSGA